MALRHKGIPFEKETPKNLGSGEHNPDFASANMRMEVPTLKDGDYSIFGSSTIVQYLEDNFPTTPALLPGKVYLTEEQFQFFVHFLCQ
jgi:glutathione S-transferase